MRNYLNKSPYVLLGCTRECLTRNIFSNATQTQLRWLAHILLCRCLFLMCVKTEVRVSLGPGFLAGIAVPVVTPAPRAGPHTSDLGAKRNYITGGHIRLRHHTDTRHFTHLSLVTKVQEAHMGLAFYSLWRCGAARRINKIFISTAHNHNGDRI